MIHFGQKDRPNARLALLDQASPASSYLRTSHRGGRPKATKTEATRGISASEPLDTMVAKSTAIAVIAGAAGVRQINLHHCCTLATAARVCSFSGVAIAALSTRQRVQAGRRGSRIFFDLPLLCNVFCRPRPSWELPPSTSRPTASELLVTPCRAFAAYSAFLRFNCDIGRSSSVCARVIMGHI